MIKFLLILFFIPVFTKAQRIITIPGTGGGIISDPGQLAFDRHGNMYCGEGLGNKVIKIDTAGVISVFAGTGATGYSGDGGPATAAVFNQPASVATDTFGNVYIGDAGNYRIRKVNVATGIVTTIAGTGLTGFGGDGGPATNASVDANGLCFDKYGNLYFGGTGQKKIRKIDAAGIITTIAGVGIYGSTGDGGPATAAECSPDYNLCFDIYGNLYFVEFSNNTIRKIDTLGIIYTIAGDSTGGAYTFTGDGVSALGAPMEPGGIAFNEQWDLIISDDGNNRIRLIDTLGIIHSIAGNGTLGYSGDGGLASVSEIGQPSGIAFDHCGNLFIAEITSPRIRKIIFDSTGLPTISISPSPNDTVCTGTGVTYITTVSNGSAITYQWYINGAFTGGDGSTYTYTPANSDSIYCVLTGVSQCSGDTVTVSSNTIYMVMTPLPHPIIDSAPCCSVPNVYSSYQWYLEGGTLIPGATTNTYVSFGSWYVVVDSAGCLGQSNTFVGGGDKVNNINAPNNQVTLSPNPATTSLSIQSTAQPISKITITNLLGQTLITQACNKNQVDINIETLPAAVYSIKVTTATGQTSISKVLKE